MPNPGGAAPDRDLSLARRLKSVSDNPLIVPG